MATKGKVADAQLVTVNLTGTSKTTIELYTAEGKINVPVFEDFMNSVVTDLKKAELGSLAAGRRFRNNTNVLSKEFPKLRKASNPTAVEGAVEA